MSYTSFRELLKGNIGVMVLTAGLWTLAGSLTGPFFSLYVLALGGSYIDVGVIAGVRAVVGILPHFFGGYLADAIGRKKLLYGMSYLLCLDQLLFAFAPRYDFLLVVATLDSLWGGLREPAFFALVADSTTPENRALAYAMQQVIPPLFGIFSSYIGGVLIDTHGVVAAMRISYVCVFITSLCASTLRWRLLRETLVRDPETKKETSIGVAPTIDGFRTAFKTLPRALWLFFLLSTILNFAYSLSGPFFVTYASDDLRLSASQWGLISMLQTLISTLVRLPAALASDRHGRMKLILPSLLCVPLTYVLFVTSASFELAVVSLMGSAFLDALRGPASQAMLVDLSKKEYRGRINALLSVPNALAGSAANVLGGILSVQISTSAPFFLSSALIFCAAVYAYVTIKEPENREE